MDDDEEEAGRGGKGERPDALLAATACRSICGSLVLVVVPAALLYVWVGSVGRV